MDQYFFGDFDLAQLSLYLFWLFFAGLVFYLQRENMREGYPMVDDDGNEAPNQGLFGQPVNEKTFHLPHGRGDVTVPRDREEKRTLAMERIMPTAGYPFAPTGDPLVDGLGPASYAEREDLPELDGEGHPKIVPMGRASEFRHFGGPDPRGVEVRDRNGAVVGTVTDMWIDKPEQLVRYLQFDLADGGGARLVPLTLAKVWSDYVQIDSLTAPYFANVPTIAGDGQITLLEEEKVMAYYAGGKLYAR